MAGPYYLSQAGGGGAEINGIGRFNLDPTTITYTDGGGNIWLRGNNFITSGLSTYPDAYKGNGVPYLVKNGLSGNIFTGNGNNDDLENHGFYVRPDGLRGYAMDDEDRVVQFNFSSAFNTSTVTLGTKSPDINKTGRFYFSPNGTRFYLLYNGYLLYQYNLSAWNLATIPVNPTKQAGITSSFNRFTISYNGSYFFYNQYASNITRWNFNTAFEVDSLTNSGASSVTLNSYMPIGEKDLLSQILWFNFNSSGTKLVVNGYGTNDYSGVYGIHEFVLSTPWNLSTISYSVQKKLYAPSPLNMLNGNFGQHIDIDNYSLISFGRNYTVGEYHYNFESWKSVTSIGLPNPESRNDFVRIK